MWKRTRLISGFGGLAALICVTAAEGQSAFQSPRNYDVVSLEMLRPRFDVGGTSLTTAAYSAAYYFGLGKTGRLFLTASLPVSHAAFDGGNAETALGNPYLGVTLFSRTDPVVYEVGITLPVASDNGGGTAGFFGDYDRFEYYQPDLLTFRPTLVYFPSRSGDWVMFTRLSPVLMIRTGSIDSEARGELLADYAIHFYYYGPAIQAGLSFTGRAALTEDGSFAERTVHHTGITIQKDFGAVIPGVQLRLPLDEDLRDVVDFTLGFLLVVPV
ncbi:MAG: hypothetical protein R3178_04570 [Rhodothermales bacterium]|nr:hypothetical protein [Rhodothermales bacterium]